MLLLFHMATRHLLLHHALCEEDEKQHYIFQSFDLLSVAIKDTDRPYQFSVLHNDPLEMIHNENTFTVGCTAEMEQIDLYISITGLFFAFMR